MRFLLLLLGIGILGCALNHTATVRVVGGNVKTVYGNGDVNTEYVSNTTFSFMGGEY